MESTRAVPLVLINWLGNTALPALVKGCGMGRIAGTPDPPPFTMPTYNVVPAAAAEEAPRIPPPMFRGVLLNEGAVLVSVVKYACLITLVCRLPAPNSHSVPPEENAVYRARPSSLSGPHCRLSGAQPI